MKGIQSLLKVKIRWEHSRCISWWCQHHHCISSIVFKFKISSFTLSSLILFFFMLHVVLKITFKYLAIQVWFNPIVFWGRSLLKSTSLSLSLWCPCILIFFFRRNFRSAWIKLSICKMFVWPNKFWRTNSLVMIWNDPCLDDLLSICFRVGLCCHINMLLPSVSFEEVIARLLVKLSSLRLKSPLWNLNWMRSFWGRWGELPRMDSPCFSFRYNRSFPSIRRYGTIFWEHMHVVPTNSYHLHFNQRFLYFSMHLLYWSLFVQIIKFILNRFIQIEKTQTCFEDFRRYRRFWFFRALLASNTAFFAFVLQLAVIEFHSFFWWFLWRLWMMNVRATPIFVGAAFTKTVHSRLCQTVHYLPLFFNSDEFFIIISTILPPWKIIKVWLITTWSYLLLILDKVREFQLRLIF